MYKEILVPLSLEHGIAPEALRAARALLSDSGAITALHVHEAASVSVRSYLDDDAVQKAYDDAKARLDDRIAGEADITATIQVGHAARTILDFAEEHGTDCIVIGSHKPGLTDYFLGSTSSRVVRHASCAVHVLRD